ncbi:MAG: F0F1 ATP synthase subunit epsilon [Pseudomonadota bacterium]
MATFPFELVSPERLLVSGQVEAVTLPGSEGEFQVMANHAPLLAMLGPGIMDVSGGDVPAQKVFIDGGFVDVNANGCTVLAESAYAVDDLPSDHIDGLIADAEARIAEMEADGTRDDAMRRLATLKLLKTAV